jgi:tRNA(His) guanylyltransferase
MRITEFSRLGALHKMFEAQEDRRLMPGLPFVVRLDGRAFHTFTRGLARPYDERLSRSMIEVAKFLVEETHASIAYTQSDEITLTFPNTDINAGVIYEGRVQKICSIFAALASVKMLRLIMANLPEKAHLTAVFDAKVYAYPSLELTADNILWREADATRNSLTMAAQAFYSHKELHKAGYEKKHEMLFAKGVNWNDYPVHFKRGTYVRREKVEKHLTPAELARIPEARRPTGPVIRSELSVVDMPPIAQVENLHGTLFFGEKARKRELLEVVAA